MPAGRSSACLRHEPMAYLLHIGIAKTASPSQTGGNMQRRRVTQLLTLQDRLAAWAAKIRKQASKLPPGAEQDALLKKAGQAEAAAKLHDWADSPGLQPPK
jgi:hypothetical protein